MGLDRYDAAYYAHPHDWAFLAGPRVAAVAVLPAGLGAPSASRC